MAEPAQASIFDILRYGLPADLLIIDFHTHLGRWFHWGFFEDSAAQLVARMDALGIKTSVSHHTLGIVGECRRGNDIIGKAMRDFPGRIEGAAGVSPHHPQEIRPELQRCRDHYDIRMIKLHPGTHQYPLDGKGYWPVYEFAAEHRLIVVTHCGAKAPDGSAAQLAEMAARHPEATFVAYHVASDFEGAEIYGEAVRANPNYYADIGGTVANNVLEKVVAECGEDRVLFGSDHMFIGMPPTLGRIASSRLTETQKRKVLGLNAARLLSRLRGTPESRVGAAF